MYLSLLSCSNCLPPSLFLSDYFVRIGVSDKAQGGGRGGGGGGKGWCPLKISVCIDIQCYLFTQTEAERKIFQVIFETSQTASEKLERFITM
jgi:hypothetical protein